MVYWELDYWMLIDSQYKKLYSKHMDTEVSINEKD